MSTKKIIFYCLLPLFILLAMVGVPTPSAFAERKKNPTEQAEVLEEDDEQKP